MQKLSRGESKIAAFGERQRFVLEPRDIIVHANDDLGDEIGSTFIDSAFEDLVSTLSWLRTRNFELDRRSIRGCRQRLC